MKIRRAGWITGIVLAGLAAYGCVTLTSTNAKVNEAAKTEAELQQQVDRLLEENASLRHAIENQDDPDTIEDIAREKLGLVMPDEQIYYDAGD